MTDDQGGRVIVEMTITIQHDDQSEPSKIEWLDNSLRFEKTRRAAVIILRGLALELEGQR